MFPICLDASPYSLPCRDGNENEYAARLHSTMCMGIGLYLRPKQHMLILCSTKIENNVRRVAQVLDKLTARNRARVLVLVHDGVYKTSTNRRVDTPEDIADACTMVQLEFHSATLESVRRCYVFSRVAKKTSLFVQQIDAVIHAYRAGAFAEVGLAMRKIADLRAAVTLLAEAAVPIRFIIVSMHTEDIANTVEWANGRGIHILTYDESIVIQGEVTRITTTRNSLTHMTQWMAAVAAQPAIYAALRQRPTPTTE
jgi:hypothetical protein